MVGRIDIEKTLQLQPNKECLFVSVATILNELVDAVNKFEKDREEIKEWIAIVGDLRKQVRELQETFESIHPYLKYKDLTKAPAENVLTKSLRMDKEFVEEEMERLQKENSDLKDEVEKLQKQLERAKSHLNCIKNNYNSWTPYRDDQMRAHAANCLAEIKELEDGNL